MAESPPATGRVFMSYRRQETAYAAGWLFDRLVEHLGAGQVFKDVDSIELGDDFVEAITTAVGSCDVLLALIGDQWLTITDEDGRRRLDDPADFVHLEIEAALTRGVRVIPILVEGARMPRADELPPNLAGLVRRQALELSPSRFKFDTSRLLRVLDKTLAQLRTGQAVADSTSAPPVEAPGPITTEQRREPAPEVEPATPVRPPPERSADSAGLGAAKQRAKAIWASRAARLTIAAALIALVTAVAVWALNQGSDAPRQAKKATPEARLLQVIPASVQKAGCKPVPETDAWTHRDGAEAQEDCELPRSALSKAVPEGGLTYGLFPSAGKARALVRSDFESEVAKKSWSCGRKAETQLEDDYPGGKALCYTNDDGDVVINWSYRGTAVFAQLYVPGTSVDAAVDARAKLL
jgi:TIR domain-containing protein